MTPLDKTLKRSLSIDGADYVVTLTPEAIKLTRKGKRLGIQLKWTDITSGETALALALQASVGQFDTRKRRADPATSSASNAREQPVKDQGKPASAMPTRQHTKAKRSR
jgi:hypothetical protein